MKTQVKVIILTWVLLLSVGVSLVSAAQFQVKAVLLKDLQSGRILYQQSPDRLIPPASLTKVMTLYLVWDAIASGKAKTTDKVKVSHAADQTGGSSMALKAGETIRLLDLIKGMAVASGNDACVAVAEHFGGQKAFVEKMNKKAKELGLKHTHFKNPHGLPAKGQVTTARDMMVLTEAYLKRFSKSLEIHSLRSFSHNKVRKRNSNFLLGKCKGLDGLKTGYVAASGFNIIATAKRDGHRLAAVVLGGRTSNIRNAETNKILEMGFKMLPGSKAILASQGQKPGDQTMLKQGMYCLQESSWKSFEQARARARALESLGVVATISVADLGNKGVWNRVLIGAFPDIGEAQRTKRTLAESHDLSHPIIRRVNNEKLIPVSDRAM